MAINIIFRFNHQNKIYKPEDVISGEVLIDCKSETRHDGITLSLEGVMVIQILPKGTRLLESFVNNTRPIILTSCATEIAKAGKFSSGQSSFSFEIPIKPNLNRQIYETYHGMNIVVQYFVKCDLRRSLLAKDISKSVEIFLESKPSLSSLSKTPKRFCIKPETHENIRERTHIPNFSLEGRLDSTVFKIYEPLTGEICINNCEGEIRSVEVYLNRVETCGSSEVNTREVSDIQITQICCGDIPRGIKVPIHVVFPRLLTCVSVETLTFKIEFEINIVIIFANDHHVKETFPIKLIR